MTKQALEEAIRRLIIKRREAHNDCAEQERISQKLTKLYDLKWLMMEQEYNKGENYGTIHNC